MSVGLKPRSLLTEAVIRALPIGVAIFDPDQRALLINPAFCVSVGMPPDSLPAGHRPSKTFCATAPIAACSGQAIPSSRSPKPSRSTIPVRSSYVGGISRAAATISKALLCRRVATSFAPWKRRSCWRPMTMLKARLPGSLWRLQPCGSVSPRSAPIVLYCFTIRDWGNCLALLREYCAAGWASPS